jgi:hypothetical protein
MAVTLDAYVKQFITNLDLEPTILTRFHDYLQSSQKISRTCSQFFKWHSCLSNILNMYSFVKITEGGQEEEE